MAATELFRFATNGGREVKTIGDGFPVDFASTVQSVRCAAAIQEAITERNSLETSKEGIDLRIGIHLGDMVEEGEDILGDAVNVASRWRRHNSSSRIIVGGESN